ncbi:MAG: S41 family peptidase [Bacteroidota bacterium]
MFRYLFLLLLFPALLSAQRYFPVGAIDSTAERIFTEIKEKHPFPASLKGLAALEAARTQVQSKIETAVAGQDSITYAAFMELMAPLQQVTDCGHLILEPHFDSLENQALRENVLPLEMTLMPDGRHVLYKGLKTTLDSFPPGTEVLTLGGKPIGPLLASMAPFSGLNDQGNNAASRLKVIRFPSLFYQWHYGLHPRVELQLRDVAGEVHDRIIEGVHRPYVDPKKVATDINKTLSFRFSEDGKTGILKIKKFSAYKFKNGNYYRFIRHVFDTLRQTNTDQLVIDIRDNTGGSSGRINALYRYFAKKPFKFSSQAIVTGPARAQPGEPVKIARLRATGAVSKSERKVQKALTKTIKPFKKKFRFTGKVVVLINEISFSASGIFARYVQASGRGKLVGMTAGASSDITYGGSRKKDPVFIGPNDCFELKVNTIGLVPEFPVPGNVTPDVEVPITMAALRAGRDEQLEVALDVVAGRR